VSECVHDFALSGDRSIARIAFCCFLYE